MASGTISQDDIDSLLSEIEQEQSQGRPAADSAPAARKGAEPTVAAEEFFDDGGANKNANVRQVEAETLRVQAAPQRTFSADAPRDIDFLLDVPLQVSVEVGRTHMTVGDLLTLGPGSLVELDKLAGEPLEVYINRKLVARGEAVIVNEKFGVRLTDVVSRVERIQNLKA